MKTLYEIIAGSKLYGLETAESDTDIRGVFLNTLHGQILGLEKNEISKQENSDSLHFEFLHFLKSLRKTNTQVIELIFSENPMKTSAEFEEIKHNKYRLLDSKKLFSSLIGYIHNEKRLANGERTGELGSKRKKQLDQFGFSPKNFSHLLRLAYCGKTFFETAQYPVDLRGHKIRDLLFSIKTEPEKYNKEFLNKTAESYVLDLIKSFENRKQNFIFDIDLANHFCLKFYYPFLESARRLL